MSIELSFFDPINLEIFNRLVNGTTDDEGTIVQKGMPPGLFIDKRFHLIPHFHNKTAFKLTVSSSTIGDVIDIDMAYIGITGDLEQLPSVTFVPQFVTSIVFLPIVVGLNLVTATNRSDLTETFSLIINSKNYGTVMMAYAQELFPAQDAIREQTQAIFNPFATRLMEPLVARSDLLPDIEVIQGMALRFISVSQMAQPGSDIGVEDIAKSLTSNTPVFDKHTQTDTLLPSQFKIFTAQELFGGFAGHLWYPNKQLNRWLAFQKLITNLGLTISQYDENVIEFTNIFGVEERHTFDTTIEESLIDFRTNINNFNVLTKIISQTRIPIPAAGYPFDLVVDALKPLGATRLTLDSGTPFDSGGTFDSDPIDPLHDGFIGIPLTGRFNFDGLGKPVLDSMIGPDTTYSPPSPTGFNEGYFTHDLAIFGVEETFDNTVGASAIVIEDTTIGPNKYINALAETTTTSSTFSTVISLTETYNSGELYIGFVTWLQQGGSSIETRLTDDSFIKGHNIYENEASTDYVSAGCFFHFTGAGASRTTLLELASTDNAAEVRVKDAHMLIYHVNLSVEYTDVQISTGDWSTSIDTSLTSYQVLETLTFTPPVAENYLIIASQDITSDSTTDDIFAELDVAGTSIGEAQFRVTTTSERRNITFVWVANLPTSSQTIRTRFRASGGSETVSVTKATLAVVPFGGFTGEQFAANSGEVSKSSTGFSDGVALNWTPGVSNPYFWLGSARTRIDNVASSHQFRMNNNGGFTIVPVQSQPAATTSYVPAIIAHRNGSGTSARIDKLEYAGTDAGVDTKFLDDQVVFAISLELPIIERLFAETITSTLDALFREHVLFRQDSSLITDELLRETMLDHTFGDTIILLDSFFGSHMTLRDFVTSFDPDIEGVKVNDVGLLEKLLDHIHSDSIQAGAFLTDTLLIERGPGVLEDFIQPGQFVVDALFREILLDHSIFDFIQLNTFVTDGVLIERNPFSVLFQDPIGLDEADPHDSVQRFLDRLIDPEISQIGMDEADPHDVLHVVKAEERAFDDPIGMDEADPHDTIASRERELFRKDSLKEIGVDITETLLREMQIVVVLSDSITVTDEPLPQKDSINVFDSHFVEHGRRVRDSIFVIEFVKQNETAIVLTDNIQIHDWSETNQIRRERLDINDSLVRTLDKTPFSDNLALLSDTFGTNYLHKTVITLSDAFRKETFIRLADGIDNDFMTDNHIET